MQLARAGRTFAQTERQLHQADRQQLEPAERRHAQTERHFEGDLVQPDGQAAQLAHGKKQ